MTEEKNTGSDAAQQQAGSPDNLIQAGPSANGESAQAPQAQAPEGVDMSKFVPKEKYEEFEKKLGEQGKELGDWRDFYGEVSPLLDKLQERPDIVEAIMDDKISADMANAIADGKFTIKDATEVKEAHDEVKKELGKKEYSRATPEDIEKLVSEKVEAGIKEGLKKNSEEVNEKLTNAEEKAEFMKSVEEFVKTTEDFGTYADDINDWFEEHPDQYDVEIAYNAVKGRALSFEAAKSEEVKRAEAQKDLAANAAGGASQGKNIVKDEALVDQLIASAGNPNS